MIGPKRSSNHVFLRMMQRLFRCDDPGFQQLFHQRMITGDLPQHSPVQLIGAAVSDVKHVAGSVSPDYGRNQRGAHPAEIVSELGISPCHAICFFTCFQHETRIIGQTGRIGGEISIEVVHKCFGRELAGETAGVCSSHAVTERKNGTGSLFTVLNQKAVLVFLSDFSLVCEPKAVHCHTFLCPYVFWYLRRSCPQDASISLPRRRRTVTVTPASSSVF